MEFIEAGPFSLFARAWPQRTIRFWTGSNPTADRMGERRVWWGPRRLWEFRRTLAEEQRRILLWHAPDGRYMMATGLAPLALDVALRYARQPIVGLDFNDRIPLTRKGLRLLDRSHLYFKRELPVVRDLLLPPRATLQERAVLERNLGKLRSISLGIGPQRIADAPNPLPPKRTDLFFAGTIGNKNRTEGLPLLHKMKAMGVQVDLAETRLDRTTFLQRCAEARLVWSPDGVGWDCFRHYEAAAMGSVPVMPHPWIEPCKPLIDGESALYYDPNGEDLIRVVTAALRDPDRLVRMGEAARRHVLAKHLHEQVVADAAKEIGDALRRLASEQCPAGLGASR